MAAEIVQDDNVAGPQHRHELLFDVGPEALAVDQSIEDTRRGKPVAAQRPEEGQGTPMAVGSEAAQAFTLGAPATQRRHVGLDPSLVDEDELLGIELPCHDCHRWRRRAASARACSRANSVFLNLSPSRCKKSHTAVCEIFTRARPTRPSARAASDAGSERDVPQCRPDAARGRACSDRPSCGATDPVCRWRCDHLTTDDTATPNRKAADLQLSPPRPHQQRVLADHSIADVPYLLASYSPSQRLESHPNAPRESIFDSIKP
jgi:hypothetical protein